MSNLNYGGWRNWIDETYHSDSLLRPVFNKILQAWRLDCEKIKLSLQDLKYDNLHEDKETIDKLIDKILKMIEDMENE